MSKESSKESKSKKEIELEMEIEKNKKQLEECQKLKEEYLNGWKRERADFLNYKKDEMERVTELIKYGNESLILKLLEIVDNFYLAEKEIPENFKNNKWVEGIFKIKNQLMDLLIKEGIKEIDCLGKKFDPKMEEAIEEVETGDPQKSGTVVEEIKKGYTLYGKVIRPSKVRIGK